MDAFVEARLVSNISGMILLPALFLPLLAAVFLAAHRDSGSSRGAGGLSLAFAWVYGAVATVVAVVALTTEGGLSIAAPVMKIGVSGFEIEPRLFLDGRNALFLLLLGLCPPMVFTLLRGRRSVDAAGHDAPSQDVAFKKGGDARSQDVALKKGGDARSQDVAAWSLIFGLAGVFLADSLLLFYLFWEAALVAVYFWIGLHGRRSPASSGGDGVYPVLLRFVLFTLAGSLPMLASIAAVSAANFRDPGLQGLAATVSQLPVGTRAWVFLGFLLGFAVKLPLFGFHGWLRDTYNVAPPACRALLSAAMSKMGAFGLIMILATAFPTELARFAPWLLGLAAVGAVYGGVLMLAQDRLIDLLAYASLSHLSILALGVFSATAGGAVVTTGLTGATWLVFNHALIMAFLFALDARVMNSGASPDRGLLMDQRAGLRARQPRLFAFLLLAVFASASLPGLNNFPGEVLVLFAAYTVSPWLALFAGLGALIGAAALVRLLHNVWLGGPDAAAGSVDAGGSSTETAPDLDRSETLLAVALAALWLVIGLYPMLLLGPVERAFAWINALGWTG
jgi:NADH-quinone oxidoreductase subunit M